MSSRCALCICSLNCVLQVVVPVRIKEILQKDRRLPVLNRPRIDPPKAEVNFFIIR